MLSILIVDDSPAIRFHLRTLLRPYGNCDEAENGQDAVRKFSAAAAAGRSYNLILMDLMMPEMDGFTAIQQINALQDELNLPPEQRPNIAILSCKDDPQSLMRAHFDVGVEHYLTKPFTKQTLIETLENLGLLDERPPG